MQTGRTHFSGAISLETILRQTNHNMFFSNIERPKCSLVTETENKVVLRKTILRQRNLAKRKQNRCLSKIKWKSGWLPAYWKKTFFWCNSTENNNITENKPKHVFCAIKLNPTCFSNEKAKMLFLWYKTQSSAILLPTYKKRNFWYHETQKRVFRIEKRNRCFFCNKILEASDLIPNTPKQKGQKHSLRRKSLFSGT